MHTILFSEPSLQPAPQPFEGECGTEHSLPLQTREGVGALMAASIQDQLHANAFTFTWRAALTW